MAGKARGQSREFRGMWKGVEKMGFIFKDVVAFNDLDLLKNTCTYICKFIRRKTYLSLLL